MNLQSHQLFAQLCESIVFEDSTTMNLITGLPGGQQLIKYLHSQEKLSHKQAYHKVDKISWSDLKDNYRGSWVIMKYSKGVGAIKQTNGTYYAIASKGGEVETFSDGRGGNIMDFLKNKLGGKPLAFYTGTDKGDVRDIQQKRAVQKAGIAGREMSTDALIVKFKPLWARAANAAIADIKGMVGIMVKNNSFDKASNKMSQLRSLNDALNSLENGDTSTPDIFQKAVRTAVVLAASHFYPDETGEINRSYSSGYSSNSDAGIKHLLSDITNGDTSKLGTILSFFKRSLIS